MNRNESLLNDVASFASNWLKNLTDRPVSHEIDAEELRRRFCVALNEKGISAEEVIAELREAAEPGLLGSASGRFFAWVIGGSLDSALAADWLVSSWDQNAALYKCSPAASVIESIAGQWLLELLDLPRSASFAFTSGCQMAHFTCLASARQKLLHEAGWDVNRKGLYGAPPIKVFSSSHRHATTDRALRFLGLGLDSVVSIATDKIGRIDTGELRSAIADTQGPKILILNAADLNTGSFDKFREIIPFAKEHGVWTHVDGAFGLFARACASKRHFTDGIELADSWATDAHKWLNVPYDCGVAIVKDRESHKKTMSTAASYIEVNESERDEINWNPEWSRRARGIPVYAALRELGTSGVEDLVDRCCRLCHELVLGLAKLPEVEVLHEPNLNQGLVRFIDGRTGASNDDHDAMTDRVTEMINADGEAYFSTTTWSGMRALRVSVVNWRTSERDVERTINSVRKVLAQIK